MGNVSTTITADEYREEAVKVFINEFSSLRSDPNVNEEEIRERLTRALVHKEHELNERSFKLRSSREFKESSSDSLSRSHLLFLGKSSHTFLVSVDGSMSSDCAFQVALALRRKHDNIVLFHSYRPGPKMESLPTAFRVEEVRQKYESQLEAAMPPANYHMTVLPRGDGESARSVLADLVKLCKDPVPNSRTISMFGVNVPDFVVLGFSGRKNEMDNCRTFMGASTDIAFRTAPIPIIIAKRNCRRSNRTFLFCADGKEKSKLALDLLLTLVMPHDVLVVAHVTQTNMDFIGQEETQRVKRYYEAELERAGPINSRFELIEREVGSSLISVLLALTNNDIDPDFLVLAPRSKQQMANITEQIILESNASVVLCKM